MMRPRDEKELTRVASRGGHASRSASAKYVGVRIGGASVQVPVRRNTVLRKEPKGTLGGTNAEMNQYECGNTV